MNNDHNLRLADLLSDAATELNEDGMTALGTAVSIARERLNTALDGLGIIAKRSLGDESAALYARALLDCLDQDPAIEIIVEDTVVERRETP